MRPRLGVSLVVLGVAGAVGLCGCAQSPDYASTTAATLQRRVAAVTTEAAGQHYQQALDTLDGLQAAAARAEAAGTLPPKRQASIDAAIGHVRRDLEAAVAAAQQAALDARLNSLNEQQHSLLTQQQQLQQQQAQQAQQQQQQQQEQRQPTATTQPKDSKGPVTPPAQQGNGPGKNSGNGKKGKGE